MPRRKHPLEIFRESGKSDQSRTNGAKNHTGGGNSKRRSGNGILSGLKAGLSARREKKSENSRAGAGSRPVQGSRGPGEFKITLTMNHVLISLFVVVSLIITGYFGGFYKGSSSARDPGLAHQDNGPEFLGERPGPKEPADQPKKGSGTVISKLGGTYGVQVASYTEGGRSAAESARDELIRRGYKNVVNYHFRKSKTCAIMVGSYDRENHPDLLRLLERLRNVSDFPGGDKSPFKTAWVTRHPKS